MPGAAQNPADCPLRGDFLHLKLFQSELEVKEGAARRARRSIGVDVVRPCCASVGLHLRACRLASQGRRCLIRAGAGSAALYEPPPVFLWCVGAEKLEVTCASRSDVQRNECPLTVARDAHKGNSYMDTRARACSHCQRCLGRRKTPPTARCEAISCTSNCFSQS